MSNDTGEAVNASKDSSDVSTGSEAPVIQESQISDMLGDILESTGVDKKVKDTKPKDDKVSDEVGKEFTEGNEGEGDIDGSEPPKDGEGEGEVAAKDDKIAQLEQQLATLSQQISALLNNQPGNEKPAQDGTATEDPLIKEEFETAKKDLVSEFFTDSAEYDEAFDKKEKMNEILGRVQHTTLQAALRSIPSIINKIVPQYVQLYQKSMDFYKANEDLKPHAKFVGNVTNDIVSKHPDWDIDKVFTELGTESRKRLGLKKAAETAAKKDNITRPAFGKPQGARPTEQGETKLTGVEKEISEMLDVVDK